MDEFGLNTDPRELAGLFFDEAVAAISSPANGDLEEWRQWSQDYTGNAPAARASKISIIIETLLQDLIDEA